MFNPVDLWDMASGHLSSFLLLLKLLSLTLCDPMDFNLLGSSVQGIF